MAISTGSTRTCSQSSRPEVPSDEGFSATDADASGSSDWLVTVTSG
jgi:hypothetical protein